ncbi:hypothetical protein jhhlp_004933 [Lomentospora prolificans]|uniref:Cation/H+ exchanger transmembrane domain-containing protein n=1 Tax=Lomentospora prolificans TaxID=41688 RepID=A0A2N3N833_9PEZI|nr:hypothetical protein jhhlp_004933 [Lomentospora prolificans]
MPTLDVSELNAIIAIFGAFTILYGIISVKIKDAWFLGEALPAVVVGICLGPIAARFIDSEKWGSANPGQTGAITLGVMRVMIGIQLVIAGYQLPAKYQKTRWKDMLVVLLPVMTLMWLATTGCVMITIPKLTLLSALVIASCVTCTDPILSQAIAKGPFSDKFVARSLREIISSEAGANDGFGFPFLMFAVYLIRHSDGFVPSTTTMGTLERRAGDVSRQGGGAGVAMRHWFLETWLYLIVLSVVYGAAIGWASRVALKLSLKKKWIDAESYVLAPTALGLFLLGTCGCLGIDDLLACFIAGNALNWDGEYLAEILRRHDEVNASVDVLLNFGGFIYLGSILPWSEFQSSVSGITYGRLVGLGFLVLVFRRLPAIFLTYKLMPNTVADWKEALFMGYFGPIGVGAIFYVEHARHLFPEIEEATGDEEVVNMLRAMRPVVYWLAFFSIVVHGISIPILNAIYEYKGVKPIKDDSMHIRRRSVSLSLPVNAEAADRDTIIAYNRFSRPTFDVQDLPVIESSFSHEDLQVKFQNDLERGRS